MSGGDDDHEPGVASALKLLAEIRSLIREVYADGAEQFFATPRHSLGGRTPDQALRHGDVDGVREVILKASQGDRA